MLKHAVMVQASRNDINETKQISVAEQTHVPGPLTEDPYRLPEKRVSTEHAPATRVSIMSEQNAPGTRTPDELRHGDLDASATSAPDDPASGVTDISSTRVDQDTSVSKQSGEHSTETDVADLQIPIERDVGASQVSDVACNVHETHTDREGSEADDEEEPRSGRNSPFLLDHHSKRVSPDGSPAHSPDGTPVVKRVKFADARDVDDVSLDMLNDRRDSDESMVAPPCSTSCGGRVSFTELDENVQKGVLVQNSSKDASDNTASTRNTRSSKEIVCAEPRKQQKSISTALKSTPQPSRKHINGTISKSGTQNQGLLHLHPPPTSKEGHMLHGARCQWACCCGLGWFMVGAISLTAGVMLVAFLHQHWRSTADYKLSVLLYLGCGLCILGGLTLLVGLGFWTCACIIWKPDKDQPDPDQQAKDKDHGTVKRTKYVVNIDSPPSSPVGTISQNPTTTTTTVAMPRDHVSTSDNPSDDVIKSNHLTRRCVAMFPVLRIHH